MGYKIKSSGWAALAFGQPHAGASAVWYTGSATSTVTMTGGYSSSSIASPSKIKFSNVKGSKAATGEYIVTFTMPWPVGQTSLNVVLNLGPGAKGQHRGIPSQYTVARSALKK